jgi:hypothetical protein
MRTPRFNIRIALAALAVAAIFFSQWPIVQRRQHALKQVPNYMVDSGFSSDWLAPSASIRSVGSSATKRSASSTCNAPSPLSASSRSSSSSPRRPCGSDTAHARRGGRLPQQRIIPWSYAATPASRHVSSMIFPHTSTSECSITGPAIQSDRNRRRPYRCPTRFATIRKDSPCPTLALYPYRREQTGTSPRNG